MDFLDEEELCKDIFRRTGVASFNPRTCQQDSRRLSRGALNVDERGVPTYENAFPLNSEFCELLTTPAESMQQKLREVVMENRSLRSYKEQLLQNISALLLTARAEIRRKDEALLLLRNLVAGCEPKIRDGQDVIDAEPYGSKQAYGSADVVNGSGSRRRDRSSDRSTGGGEWGSRGCLEDKARAEDPRRTNSGQWRHQDVCQAKEYFVEGRQGVTRSGEAFVETHLSRTRSKEAYGENCQDMARSREICGESHPDVYRPKETCSESYQDMTRLREAYGESHLDMTRLREAYGESHLDVTRAREAYGESHLDMTRSREVYGESHQDVSRSRDAYGESHLDMTRAREAYGGSHLDMTRSREVYGESHQDMARSREAYGGRRLDMTRSREVYDENHQDVSRSRERCGTIDPLMQLELPLPGSRASEPEKKTRKFSYSPVKYPEEKKEESCSAPDPVRREGSQCDLNKKLSRSKHTVAINEDSSKYSERRSPKRVHFSPDDSQSEKVVMKSSSASGRQDNGRSSPPSAKDRRKSSGCESHRSSVRDKLKVEIGQSYSLAGCQGVASRKKSKDTPGDSKDPPSLHSGLKRQLDKEDGTDKSKSRRLSLSSSSRDHKSVKSGECNREGKDRAKEEDYRNTRRASETHIRSPCAAKSSSERCSVGKSGEGGRIHKALTRGKNNFHSDDRIRSPARDDTDRRDVTRTDGKPTDKSSNYDRTSSDKRLRGHSSKHSASGEDNINKEVISDKNTSGSLTTSDKHYNKHRPFRSLRTSAAGFLSSFSNEQLNSPSSKSSIKPSRANTPPTRTTETQERGNSHTSDDIPLFDVESLEYVNSPKSLAGLHFKKSFIRNYASTSNTNSNNGAALGVSEDTWEPIEVYVDVDEGDMNDNCNSLGTEKVDRLSSKPEVGLSSLSSSSSS